MAFAVIAASCGGGDDDTDSAAEDEGAAESSEEATDEAEADEGAEETTDDTTAEIVTTDTNVPEGRTEVRWFVGLGAGAQEDDIPRQQELINAFNESSDDAFIVAEFVDNTVAADTLATQIAGGSPPDLIGPVGVEGANAFAGQYLDLAPLIESSDIDLSVYEDSQVQSIMNSDGEQVAIPFATFPTALHYNSELFDEAGLPYPPATYGEIYGEGTDWEGEWNVEKLEEIAAFLTVDGNGVDATSPDFDRDNVAQWGFVHQFTTDPRSQGTFFGAGSVVADDGTAAIPEQWVEEWKWYHHMIWEVGASPTQEETIGEVLGDNAFASGQVAMGSTHLWYAACCLGDGADASTFWNVAAMPTYNGTATAKIHADTFRIHQDSDNPEAAFEVLRWIHEDATLDFLAIYGGMPARTDIRDAYFDDLDERFTQGVAWDTYLEGLNHTDVPNHQSDMPSFLESDARIKEFESLQTGDPGLDIDAAVAEMEADLNAIWAAAG
jgi:multiple sugar transport system substrate-binding protein